MSHEFKTIPVDPVVAADILNKAATLGREMLCQVQITAPAKRGWHVAIKCPITKLLFGGGAENLPKAWDMATGEWFHELQKKVPGVTRERVGL